MGGGGSVQISIMKVHTPTLFGESGYLISRKTRYVTLEWPLNMFSSEYLVWGLSHA